MDPHININAVFIPKSSDEEKSKQLWDLVPDETNVFGKLVYLIRHGANPASTHTTTPLLHTALSHNSCTFDYLEFLIAHGMPVTLTDEQGRSALELTKNNNIIFLLLLHGAPFKQDDLLRYSIYTMIIPQETGEAWDTVLTQNEDTWGNTTPPASNYLWKAVHTNQLLDTYKHLINPITAQETNDLDMTLAHLAAVHNNTKLIKTLIDNQANLFYQDQFQSTPLTYAVRYNHKETVLLIIAHYKAQKDYSPTLLTDALTEAIQFGHLELVELLLEAGASLNTGSEYLLKKAINNGDEVMVELLLAWGADPKQLTLVGSINQILEKTHQEYSGARDFTNCYRFARIAYLMLLYGYHPHSSQKLNHYLGNLGASYLLEDFEWDILYRNLTPLGLFFPKFMPIKLRSLSYSDITIEDIIRQLPNVLRAAYRKLLLQPTSLQVHKACLLAAATSFTELAQCLAPRATPHTLLTLLRVLGGILRQPSFIYETFSSSSPVDSIYDRTEEYKARFRTLHELFYTQALNRITSASDVYHAFGLIPHKEVRSQALTSIAHVLRRTELYPHEHELYRYFYDLIVRDISNRYKWLQEGSASAMLPPIPSTIVHEILLYSTGLTIPFSPSTCLDTIEAALLNQDTTVLEQELNKLKALDEKTQHTLIENHRDSLGNTLMHLAAQVNNQELITYLISLSTLGTALLSSQNHANQTPDQVALKYHNTDLARDLLQKRLQIQIASSSSSSISALVQNIKKAFPNFSVNSVLNA